MLTKINKFIALSNREKIFFTEAYILLGLIRLALATVSFKGLTHSLDHRKEMKELPKANEQELKTATLIGEAISHASMYTPWRSTCLVQALTAQKMLQRRGIPGVFYLGVQKNLEGKQTFAAHAWSQCGEIIITGANEHKAYTVLSVFGWDKK